MKEIRNTKFKVGSLVDGLKNGRFFIDPYVQRRRNINTTQAKLMVEAVLENKLFSPIVLIDKEDCTYEVLDGQGRIRMLELGCQLLPDDSQLRNHEVRVDILPLGFFSSENEKAQAFYRINKGHTPAKPEQMRRAKHWGNPFFRTLLSDVYEGSAEWASLVKLPCMFDSTKTEKMLDEKLLCEMVVSCALGSYTSAPSLVDSTLTRLGESDRFSFSKFKDSLAEAVIVMNRAGSLKRSRGPFISLCVTVALYSDPTINRQELVRLAALHGNTSNRAIARKFDIEETNGANFQNKVFELYKNAGAKSNDVTPIRCLGNAKVVV